MTRRLLRAIFFPVWGLRRIWRRKLTPASNLALLAIIAALNVIWGFPLLGLLVSTILLLALSWLVNWWFRPRLRVLVRTPNVIRCDALGEGSVTIKNIGTLPAFDLSIGAVAATSGWQLTADLGAIQSLESGQEASLRFTFVVTSRGEFPLPTIECRSTFPFHLFQTYKQYPSTSRLLVTPKLQAIDALQVSELARVVGDMFGGLRIGDSYEYAGSREWSNGDSPRAWDHSAWARLGRPIVREYHQLTSGHILLFVDTLVKDLVEQSKSRELERRLSLAASIIDALRWTPCEIGLIMIQADQIAEVSAPHDNTELLMASLARAMPTPVPSNARQAAVIALHREAGERIANEQATSPSSLVLLSDKGPHTSAWIAALVGPLASEPIRFKDEAAV